MQVCQVTFVCHLYLMTTLMVSRRLQYKASSTTMFLSIILLVLIAWWLHSDLLPFVSGDGPIQFDENNDMANEGRAFSCLDGHNQMDYEGDDFLQQFY